MGDIRRHRLTVAAIALAMGCAPGPLAAQGVTQGAPPPMSGAGAFADYRVGPGDLLTVIVYRSNDLQTSVRVSQAGTIMLPSLGEVKVLDMTAEAIAALIQTQLKSRGIFVDPVVNVMVAEVRSKIVSVMGAVARPGEIMLDRPGLTLAAVLARAGSEFGTGSGVVTVMSGSGDNGPREQFRIADLVTGKGDRLVKPGEILIVQAAPTFYVSGEVARPGVFPVEPGLTVGQAIALGGGVTPRGTANRIRVTRRNPDGTTTEIKGVKLTTLVMASDLITVRQRIF